MPNETDTIELASGDAVQVTTTTTLTVQLRVFGPGSVVDGATCTLTTTEAEHIADQLREAIYVAEHG